MTIRVTLGRPGNVRYSAPVVLASGDELAGPGNSIVESSWNWAWNNSTSHVRPAGSPFGVDVHETTLRENVRWVTPLGDETASTS